MKKFGFILLATVLLSGCSSIHSHDWTPANYQQPATCSVCGQSEGVALIADFDRYAIKVLPLTRGKTFEYHTVCADSDETVTGNVSVEDFRRFDSDEAHQGKSGYQWQILTLKLQIGDAASNQYGFRYNYVINDFYNIENFTRTYRYDDEKQYCTFTVNWYGKDYDGCHVRVGCNNGEWRQGSDYYYKDITITFEALLPEGYDGLVAGLRNSAVDATDRYYLNQYYQQNDFVLFRMGETND